MLVAMVNRAPTTGLGDNFRLSLYVFGFGIQQVVVNAKLTQEGRQHLGFFHAGSAHQDRATGLVHVGTFLGHRLPLGLFGFCRPRQTGLSGPGDGWWE